jgi:hypothetical protein
VSRLSLVFVFKISATVAFWCIPLIVFPASLLQAIGLPAQPSYLFLRLLGWSYLALCVGYAFGLQASLRGERAAGPIWMGILSNAGACAVLGYFGASGAWAAWGGFLQFVLWSSVVASAAIAAGLYWFGVRSASAA